MDMPERPLLTQQVADLAALKAISEFRQSLPQGSPEWVRAQREQDGVIARVVAWAGPPTVGGPAAGVRHPDATVASLGQRAHPGRGGHHLRRRFA
jgi:hypothetical protein